MLEWQTQKDLCLYQLASITESASSRFSKRPVIKNKVVNEVEADTQHQPLGCTHIHTCMPIYMGMYIYAYIYTVCKINWINSSKVFNLILNYVYLCVFVYGYVHVSAGAHRGLKEGTGSLRAGVTASRNLLNGCRELNSAPFCKNLTSAGFSERVHSRTSLKSVSLFCDSKDLCWQPRQLLGA